MGHAFVVELKEQWMVYGKKADFGGIAGRFSITPVTARILRNRDLVSDIEINMYLNGTLSDLYAPELMYGVTPAAQLVAAHIRRGSKIRIVGDYDIDGVCSTYILLSALQTLGADVSYAIPDRIKDGYGINEAIIERCIKDQIDLIITCDNGISAWNPLNEAMINGIDVVVTDHHEVPKEGFDEKLPPANVIVNPKQSRCKYPFPEICGAVVAYKFVRKLLDMFAENPEWNPRKRADMDSAKMPVASASVDMNSAKMSIADGSEELYTRTELKKRYDRKWRELLIFAAIATIGDVMKLQDENRIIVKYGLKDFATCTNMGINALVKACELDPNHITAYHIGFVIGPCLNAGGRLKTAELAMKLFTATDEAEADEMAKELRKLNDTRKTMTEQGVLKACELIESKYFDDSVYVIYLKECHESIAGIIAGRIKERYGRPTIVLTDGESDVKGSGRSIETYSMFEKLSEAKDLMLKFGGHPMAAGMSLKAENVDTFREFLNSNANLSDDDLQKKIWIDVPMPMSYVTEDLIKELSVLEPFGQGNEKPVFAERNLKIRYASVIGRNRNVVRLSLEDQNGFPFNAVYFGEGDAFMEEKGTSDHMDIVYYPDINEYNGRRTLQAVVRRYRFK